MEIPSDDDFLEFARATCWVSSEAAGSLATTSKLALYGCYKQFAEGDAPSTEPRGMEANMKWNAWREHFGVSRAEAMGKYVAVLDRIVPGWRDADDGDVSGIPVDPPTKHKADGSSGMGLSVSTMGMIGDPSKANDTDETPVGQLCALIADGSSEEALTMLKKNPQLAFQSDKDGMSALHWAADRGELQVARALVDMLRQSSVADLTHCVNAKDAGEGETPLHYAVNTDNVELARLLIAARADPSIENSDGETALSVAEGKDSWVGVLTACAQ